MDLAGKPVVVLGGADGIGLEIAKAAMNANASVIATASSQMALEDAKTQHPKISWILSNFASTESRKSVAETIIDAKPNVVIFNQAIVERRDFSKPADPHIPPIWLEVQDNFTAPMEITQTLTGALFGHDMRLGFVTTNPADWTRAMPVYAATQAGLAAFVDELRAELMASNSKITLRQIRLPFVSEFPEKAKKPPAPLDQMADQILRALIMGDDTIELF